MGVMSQTSRSHDSSSDPQAPIGASAAAERQRLADLFASISPDAPTLCEDWTVKDLLVHMVIREYRPDAILGLAVPPLASHLKSVTAEYETKDYHDLISQYRQGPPRWSPIRLIDRYFNLAENFVHHEDVRRGGMVSSNVGAGEGLTLSPRRLTDASEGALWQAALIFSKALLRQSKCAITLRRVAYGSGEEVTTAQVGAKPGPGVESLTVSGTAGEVMLWVYGREAAADVAISGSEAARRGVKRLPL